MSFINLFYILIMYWLWAENTQIQQIPQILDNFLLSY